jgi:serine/threonine protein phosphatase PrpC
VTNLLDKIFRRKKKADYLEEDTIPLKSPVRVMEEEQVTKPLTPLSSLIPEYEGNDHRMGVEPSQLFACCSQSIGRQRDHNEDAMFCLTTTMASNGVALPFGLYIVADGMGGHQYGEVASEIAIRTMAEHLIQKVFTNLIGTDQEPPEEPLQEIMKTGIQKAHNNILNNVTGGGTTLTTVTIMGNQMTIGHVGDSRVYAITPNGVMKPLTRDHSLVKRLEELGQLTPEEAALDPRRNVLYHALGQGTPLEPEIITAPIPHPGYLLVCSDGLWGVISEKTIGEIILSAETLPEACQKMVDAANEAGGPDNITSILIKLPD